MNPAEPLLELTEATLDDALAAATVPVLLDLWAPWCQPCLAMAPVLDGIAAACAGRLRLAKVDVEQHPEVSARFRVRGIPTLILIKNGVEVDRQIGPKSAAELKAFLARHGVEAAPATALDDSGAAWGAFYGDESLRTFLLDRLQAFAASGAVFRARLPSWAEGSGSVSAALVRHADPRVFERVSGMPFGFACALEFAGLGSAAEIAEVLGPVPAGADLGPVAWNLVRWWLADPASDWAAALGDAAVDALRRRWLELSAAARTGASADAAWAALRQDAGRLVGERDPRRELQRSMAQLVEELSPPPAADDVQGWLGALLVRGNYLKYAALVIAHGWSADDLAQEGIRFARFEARAAAEPGGRFSDERLTAVRAEWEAEHADPAYRTKVSERDAAWATWQAAQHLRIRQALSRLAVSVPVIA